MLTPTGTIPRTEKFIASYERDVLFYDVFWHVDGGRVILIGPPPIDLAPLYQEMTTVAVPSGRVVRLKRHHSRKVWLFSAEVPEGTSHLDISFAGVVQRVEIGLNHSPFFAGENLLFTLSKNNDLGWVRDWAHFHVVNQGVSAVLVFDNGSDRYTLDELAATLTSVKGLRKTAVVRVPFRYTGPDEAMESNKFWAHFLQPSTFTGMFRRYGAQANGILNCDIDELAVPTGAQTVFETATASRSGTVYFRNLWIEPVPEHERVEGYRHRDFRQVLAEADYRQTPTQKWALTPQRRWLQNLKIHPYTHLLKNRPPFTRHKPLTAYIAHFKAISTGWKYDRPVVLSTAAELRREPTLDRALDRAFPD